MAGNTIVDAVMQNLDSSRENVEVLEKPGVEENHYFLATLHRRENVDNE